MRSPRSPLEFESATDSELSDYRDVLNEALLWGHVPPQDSRLLVELYRRGGKDKRLARMAAARIAREEVR
ncbi:hypothetical protein [Mycolicibacterium fortuitum]|nr:hypothetical protein [Mycolicibacterium fortuitum]